MNNTVPTHKNALIRSIPYWLLLALSVVAIIVGGWLVWDRTTTMQTTLLDGSATNVEVYVGQAWITAGAAILAAGVIGILLALVVAAAKALVPTSDPVVVETIDWTAEDELRAPGTATAAPFEGSDETPADETASDSEGQNGSSGSTATATKISVK